MGVPTKKLRQVIKERRLVYLQKFEILAKNDRGASFVESDTESDNSFNRTITEALDVLEKSMSVIGNKFKNIDESTENFKPILKGTENSSTPRKPIMDLKTEKESTLKSKDETMPSINKSVFTTQIKFDTKTSIPIWHSSADQTQNQILLENYISDLKRVKKLSIFDNDQILIFSSVNSSNKTHVFNELPTEAQTDLNKFCEFISKAYGRSHLQMRQGLANFKQFSGESIYTFFYRAISTYYRARDAEPKSIDEIDNNKVERNDIIYYFVNGLRDEGVRKTVRTQLINIDFKNLPDVVKNLSDLVGVNEEEKKPIFNIQSQVNTNLEQKIDALSTQMNKIMFVRKKKPFLNQKRPYKQDFKNKASFDKFSKRKEIRTCFNCNKKGHIAKNCWSRRQEKR